MDKLLKEAHLNNVDIHERTMPKRIKGLYADNVIWLNSELPTTKEKRCVLAEELGHYHTSIGDIIDQSNLYNRKQEKQARNWAYKRLIPLHKIIKAFDAGVQSKYELAEYLNVTEAFLLDALKRYKEEYGVSKNINKHTIYFEPLAVMKIF